MTRLFFATDVHGSERVFRKFVNAAKFYKADTLILGGDITGKIIILLIEQPNGSYIANFLGAKHTAKTKEEIESLEKNIRFTGCYPYRTSPDQAAKLESEKEMVDGLFSKLMIDTLRSWLTFAEERLRNSGVRCYISPGNDDVYDIDDVLNSSSFIINPEGRVVEIDQHHEMISTGHSNITPWNAPRDISEEELTKKIDSMVSQVRDINNSIFNLHCPPINSVIDSAPKLDKDLRPIVSPAGGFEMISAGSLAVRNAIENYQPLLGLHGHIHESKGLFKLKKTLCLNPGSESTDGVLRGAIVNLDKKGIQSYQLVSG
jgi:Icc-related predicted phosphoesterase